MCRVVSCRVVSFKCAKKQSLHTKHGKECVNLLTNVEQNAGELEFLAELSRILADTAVNGDLLKGNTLNLLLQRRRQRGENHCRTISVLDIVPWHLCPRLLGPQLMSL